MRASSRIAMAVAVWLLSTAAGRADVDFARQVHPILVKKCFSCHSASTRQGKLSLETIDSLLAGGVSGPAVAPNAAERSPLYQRVAGLVEPRMPLGMARLTDSEIATLRSWIDEGAKWKESSEGPLRAVASFAPREVAVPQGQAPNPIDRFAARYQRSRGLTPPETVSDSVFIRRAYLDLWGFTPPPRVQSEFVSDSSASKRRRLIDRLLADDALYAEHWISFWNDLLRNDEGVVYYGGRESITDWLLAALERNESYDEMVRELLSPRGEGAPEGFLIGVNWRGTVNASQTPPMQAAQNSAQVFLGVNLKCASCHDSFINQWKLADSYGLASFFSDEPLELVRCDAPTGEMAAVRFLYPELGGAEASAALAERRQAAAELFTAGENGRFARTIVNRYWKKLLGRGLVEPADDMDQPAWEQDLLDWLASDFVANGYDLKHLLRQIMTSRAYQSVAEKTAQQGAEYVFRGPNERRMSAEQFADSLSSITGEWAVRETAERAEWARDWRLKATPLGRALGRPVRDQVFTERNENATTLQALELLNGETLTRRLRRGSERLLGRLPDAPAALWDSGITRREVREFDIDVSGADNLYLLVVDADSYDPSRVVAGWANARLVSGEKERPLLAEGSPLLGKLEFKESSDEHAVAGGIPMRIEIATHGATRLKGRSGVALSSQASDINPRVRFFIFAEQPNLERLVVPRGPSPIRSVAAALPEQPREAVTELYRRALGREPTQAETAVGLELLQAENGAVPTAGLEDLLWSLALLPEFQIIR